MTTITSIMRQMIHRAVLVLAVATVATQSVQAAEVHPSVPSEVTLEWLAGAFEDESAEVTVLDGALFVTYDAGLVLVLAIDPLTGDVAIATGLPFRYGVSAAEKNQVVRRIADGGHGLFVDWKGPLLMMGQRVPKAGLRTHEDVRVAAAELLFEVAAAITEAEAVRYLMP